MTRRLSIVLLMLSVIAGACTATDEAADAPEPASSPVVEPRWTRIDAHGPPARTDHGLAATGDAVYLFGGRSNRQELGDLWRLDLSSGAWTELTVNGEAPGPRFGAAFEATPDGSVVLFGGESRSTGTFFNDVWRFDPGAQQWTKLGEGGPDPRYGAGSAVDADGILYVTHGFTATGRFDDTWSLQGGEFVDRSGEGERPIARCLLRAAHHDGGLLIFGGQSNPEPFLNDLWRLDLDEGRWQRLDPEQRPPVRNLYSAAQLGGDWWIHGGRGPDGPLGDLWRLDLGSGRFEQIDIDGAPAARSGHAAAPLADGLVLFGGQGADGELSDTWHLTF